MMRLSALVCLTALIAETYAVGFDGIYTPPYKWCGRTSPPKCCPGVGHPDYPTRDDECTVDIEIPIHGPHECYCDEFCDRTSRGGDKDCCPDWEEVCKGPGPTRPPPTGSCQDQSGHEWSAGQTVTMNCWTCECTSNGWANCDPSDIETSDPDSSCLIQDRILKEHKINRYKWQASNYTQFWGKTLKHGIIYRLGTLAPDEYIKKMSDIKIPNRPAPRGMFDARQEWPDKISGVFDQENCGSSWAFSTISVAADRNAIMGNKSVERYSAQNLLSCNQAKQRGCDGGYLDRAWNWIWHKGVVSEECYPYQSGRTNKPGACQISIAEYKSEDGRISCPSGTGKSKVALITPSYKIKGVEDDIMAEIIMNGPVQASFRVYEDFFHYQSGVYRRLPMIPEDPNPDRNGYHSVKILGFGTEAGEKYWLCQNSWGTNWGEQGLFKIVRGENHCEIESFVITAVGFRAKKKKRKMIRRLRRRKLLF